ncbi:hypothetical protein [Rhodopirellula bahusiensis]|uniref:hypothetical protein n=1 Tax=Rhodopirellula bahusiensis TaxID=2014065 RepID=UPI003264F627
MPSEPNPYSVGETSDNQALTEEPRTFLGRVWVFVRVTVVSLVWMVVCFFVSAMVLGFLTVIHFNYQYAGNNTPARPSAWISIVWMLAPQVIGLLGFILGMMGRLPGTRR